MWMECKCVCSPASTVVMVCLLRYAQVIEHSHRCWVNTSALVSGCTNALGLVMVGNFQVNLTQPISLTWRMKVIKVIGDFSVSYLDLWWYLSVWQVDHAKSLHYVGAGVAFPAGLLFVCLQCVLTYRVAVTALDYWMAHFRVALALGAMISLVLSILSREITHHHYTLILYIISKRIVLRLLIHSPWDTSHMCSSACRWNSQVMITSVWACPPQLITSVWASSLS